MFMKKQKVEDAQGKVGAAPADVASSNGKQKEEEEQENNLTHAKVWVFVCVGIVARCRLLKSKKRKEKKKKKRKKKLLAHPAPPKQAKPIVHFEDVVHMGTADPQPFSYEYLIRERFQAEKQQMRGRHGDVCRFFSRGYCVKGQTCPYRHERNDKAVVCKHWLRGLCKKGPLCDFLHEFDLSKMPECYFFSQYGECTNEDCLYLHITNLERTEVCPWFERGFCKHGHACRNRHVKKPMCERFLAGFCPDGSNCMAGHPKYGVLEETRRCHQCNKIGHMSSQCPEGRGGRGRGRGSGAFVCYNCQGTGHMARECPNARRDGGRGRGRGRGGGGRDDRRGGSHRRRDDRRDDRRSDRRDDRRDDRDRKRY